MSDLPDLAGLPGLAVRYRRATAQLRRVALTDPAYHHNGTAPGPRRAFGDGKRAQYTAQRDAVAKLIAETSPALLLALVEEDVLLREIGVAVARDLHTGGIQQHLTRQRKLIARLLGKKPRRIGTPRPHWPQPED